MDIKAPLEIYEAAAGVSVNIQDIQRSMEILRSSNLNYVFRTTVVPGLIQAEEIQAIAELLQKDETYILQGFIPQNTINAEFLEKNPYISTVKIDGCLDPERSISLGGKANWDL